MTEVSVADVVGQPLARKPGQALSRAELAEIRRLRGQADSDRPDSRATVSSEATASSESDTEPMEVVTLPQHARVAAPAAGAEGSPYYGTDAEALAQQTRMDAQRRLISAERAWIALVDEETRNIHIRTLGLSLSGEPREMFFWLSLW